jgi:hypothetical protein
VPEFRQIFYYKITANFKIKTHQNVLKKQQNVQQYHQNHDKTFGNIKFNAKKLRINKKSTAITAARSAFNLMSRKKGDCSPFPIDYCRFLKSLLTHSKYFVKEETTLCRYKIRNNFLFYKILTFFSVYSSQINAE